MVADLRQPKDERGLNPANDPGLHLLPESVMMAKMPRVDAEPGGFADTVEPRQGAQGLGRDGQSFHLRQLCFSTDLRLVFPILQSRWKHPAHRGTDAVLHRNALGSSNVVSWSARGSGTAQFSTRGTRRCRSRS